MNFQLLTSDTRDSSPEAVHVTTGDYAYSATGYPLATNGLMGCMGIVVHDPATGTGCLAHAQPENIDTAARVQAFFESCFTLMGYNTATAGSLEVVFVGSNASSTGSFDTNFLAVQGNLGLQTGNLHDARSYQSLRGRVLGTTVPNAPPIASSVTYDPGTGTVWVGDGTVPRYNGATKNVTGGVNGLQLITGDKLTGGGKSHKKKCTIL